MVYLLQVGLFVGLLAVSRRIFKSSFAANVVALGQRLAAVAAGYASGWLASQLLLPAVSNFALRMLIASGVGLAVFGITAALLSRWSRRNAWAEACASAFRLPRWVDRASRLVMLVAMWGGALIALDFWVQLQHLATAPQPHAARRPQARAETDSEEIESVHAAMLLQNDFLNRFQRGLDQSREEFYAAIGAQEVLVQVQAIQQINALPLDDKIWLIEQNPKIARLANHPTLLRIVSNDSLVANLERVGNGSITAIYEIGADPDVCELLDDPKVLRLVREIDPLQLLKEVQQHRRRQLSPANSPN